MRPNRLQYGNIEAHIAFLIIRPRQLWLERPGESESEVDGTEEAKQVALYRYELTGERYDDDEIRSFYEDDIVNLDVEDREAITFESWLWEYVLHGVFYEEENRTRSDRQSPLGRPWPRINFKTLHEMPSTSSDWTARQPHAHWVARMTKRPAPTGVGRSASERRLGIQE